MNNINNFPSAAENQNRTFENVSEDSQMIKQEVVNEIKSIENLVNKGALSHEEGQNLVNYVTQKAFEKYILSAQNQQQQINTPEFFNKEGRMDVFDYLKNSNVNYDADELSKISALVEKLENTAIERYAREKEHEKTLNSENEAAKQKLRAIAQNAVSDGTKNRVFTREQIGKMSGAEFAKHERAIMEQLKKGLIR